MNQRKKSRECNSSTLDRIGPAASRLAKSVVIPIITEVGGVTTCLRTAAPWRELWFDGGG